MCLFCEIQIFKIGDSTMFEEIKDYQGKRFKHSISSGPPGRGA